MIKIEIKIKICSFKSLVTAPLLGVYLAVGVASLALFGGEKISAFVLKKQMACGLRVVV